MSLHGSIATGIFRHPDLKQSAEIETVPLSNQRLFGALGDVPEFFSSSACIYGSVWCSVRDVKTESQRRTLHGIGKSERRLPKCYRTFSPYFCVVGGTIPFKRRYSTSCP